MGHVRSDLPPVVRRMLERDFYPHPVTDPITLIQTHISYVLLTGQYAYKVKKPVNLGFLDFTTLQSRQHFCLEEVRLNRRGAPDIYLEVLPICREGDGFRLGGRGTAAEYAVKMRQFPHDALFSVLLPQGRLSADLVEELGKAVAGYHLACETNPHISAYGAPAWVKKTIDDNYAHTLPFVGDLQTHEHYQQTKNFTDSFFRDSGKLIDARAAGGFVRECHGDLHLGNICLWQGKVLFFDCIEFSESLRSIDVVQDAAFAAMDLEAAGRTDLAALYINTYAEHTGDWEGLQLLRLYLCRHACVRAMVNSMIAFDQEMPEPERNQARSKAKSYYELGWQYALPRKGRLILMSGLSGSGKSTLARRLAQRLGALHLRSDAVRKHLAQVGLGEKGDDTFYTAAMTRQTYSRLLELGLLLARGGATVILDAKYDRRAFRESAIEGAGTAGLAIRIIHCAAPQEVLSRRLNQRRGDVSDAGPELLERQQREFEDFAEHERTAVTVVDTSQPVDEWAILGRLTGT